MEKTCMRAYQNTNGSKERMEDFIEHVRTCEVCNQIINNLEAKQSSDFLNEILGI